MLVWCFPTPSVYRKLEQVKGIEPSHGHWQCSRLPLHHTCVYGDKYTQVPKKVKPSANIFDLTSFKAVIYLLI